MTTTNAQPGRRRRASVRRLSSARVRALLSIGVVLGLTSVSTLAYWTDEATLTTAPIESGFMNMLLDGQENVTSSTALAITGMFPGESVAATIKVQREAGSVPFTYRASGKVDATNDLAKALRFRAYAGTASNSATNGIRHGTCSGAAITSSAVSLESMTELITNRATLASATGTSEDAVCIIASLPYDSTGNNAMSKTTTATLTFTANQIKAAA